MGFISSLSKMFVNTVDPISKGLMTKVTGSEDPLDLYGGATKARNEANEQALAEAQTSYDKKVEDTYNKKYNISTIGTVNGW